MNRLITCASLAALGAATLHAQAADPSSKPWSVSAKLRGFYDDNYNTAPSDPMPGFNAPKGESWGINFAPGVRYNLLRDQTTLVLQYDYDMRWFEARPENEIDDTHHGSIEFSHMFSERHKLDITDSLVYASEPSVIEPSGQQATFYRSENDAWRNYAGIGLTSGLTERLGTRIGYSNSFYDYIEDGPASRSAMLDRFEHLGSIDLRWQFQPTLVGLAGYQYGYVDYTSKDALYVTAVPGVTPPTGNIRDQESHYGFAGLDYTASPRLSFQLRAGLNYARYPNSTADDLLAPYVDFGGTYEYLEGSRLSLGVKHDLRPTDVVQPDPNDASGQSVTMSQEATTLYALVSHKLTQKLRGNVRVSWQNAAYEGGAYDGETDNFVTLDASLEYALHRNLTAEAGYAFDTLSSDIDYRGYDRNRFFFGVRATY